MGKIDELRRWWRWGSCTFEVEVGDGGGRHRVRPIDLERVELLDHPADVIDLRDAPACCCDGLAEAWRRKGSSDVPPMTVVYAMSSACGGVEIRSVQDWRVLGVRIKGRTTVARASWSPIGEPIS